MDISKILFTTIAIYFWGVVIGYISSSILWIIPMILVSALILLFEKDYINKDEE